MGTSSDRPQTTDVEKHDSPPDNASGEKPRTPEQQISLDDHENPRNWKSGKKCKQKPLFVREIAPFDDFISRDLYLDPGADDSFYRFLLEHLHCRNHVYCRLL